MDIHQGLNRQSTNLNQAIKEQKGSRPLRIIKQEIPVKEAKEMLQKKNEVNLLIL